MNYQGLCKELSTVHENESRFHKMLFAKDYVTLHSIMSIPHFILNSNEQSDLAFFSTRYIMQYYNVHRTEQRPQIVQDFIKGRKLALTD